MLPHRARVYLDANIFIHILQSHPANAAPIAALVEQIERQHIIVATSELSISEVLVRPLADNNEKLRTEYEQIFDSPELSLLPVTRRILFEAAQLRGLHKIKLPDAIHVSTAAAFGAAFLLSEDLGIRATSGLQIVRLTDLIGEGPIDLSQSTPT